MIFFFFFFFFLGGVLLFLEINSLAFGKFQEVKVSVGAEAQICTLDRKPYLLM